MGTNKDACGVLDISQLEVQGFVHSFKGFKSWQVGIFKDTLFFIYLLGMTIPKCPVCSSGLHPAGCHSGAPLGLAHGQSDPRLQRRREEGESQAWNAQQPVDVDGVHGGDGSKGLG